MRVPCRTLQKRSGECGPGPAFLWLEFWALLVRCKPSFAARRLWQCTGPQSQASTVSPSRSLPVHMEVVWWPILPLL